MNRGINDSQDLPREYLGQIYDEIAQCEIQMRAGGGSTTMAANGGTSVSSTTANGMAAGVRDLMESVGSLLFGASRRFAAFRIPNKCIK